MKIFIGLGANLGDPTDSIREAIDLIESRGLGKVVRTSSLYRTEPVGLTDQPWFINAAAQIETGMEPMEFLTGLREIEKELGRPEDRIPDGPRVIDLDILLWGNDTISNHDLEVPHPRMHERRFVLTPLCEIAPRVMHPVHEKTIEFLLENLADTSTVEKTNRR